MENVEAYYTWPIDVAAHYFRYFVMAGFGYISFYLIFQKHFANRKIQRSLPKPSFIFTEIFYSVLTLSIHCLVSWSMLWFHQTGLTKIYLSVDQYGVVYFAISIIIMIIMHDAYFYWTHRLLHWPFFFKWFHQTHHRSSNPTPWAAFSFHPAEAVISTGIIPIIVFLLPAHPFALFIFLTYMTLINVMGHLGYELFPQKFINSKLGRWQNSSSNHNHHHHHNQWNYGLYFTFWDRIMKTFKEAEEIDFLRKKSI